MEGKGVGWGGGAFPIVHRGLEVVREGFGVAVAFPTVHRGLEVRAI